MFVWCGLLWLTLPHVFRQWRYRLTLRRHLQHLTNLARNQNAPGLYQALQTPSSRTLLRGTERTLVAKLESVLFSTNAAHRPDDHPPLMDWLTPVIEKSAARRPVHQPPNDNALAKL